MSSITSALQLEMKLNNGQFDPCAQLRRFLLTLIGERCFQNKRHGQKYWNADVSVKMWTCRDDENERLHRYIAAWCRGNRFPPFLFSFLNFRCIILSRWNPLTVRKQAVSGFIWHAEQQHPREGKGTWLMYVCEEKRSNGRRFSQNKWSVRFSKKVGAGLCFYLMPKYEGLRRI